MSITYYAKIKQEPVMVNIQEGEILLYTGTTRPGLRSGPSASDGSRKAYAYYWSEGRAEDIITDFEKDRTETWALDFTVGGDHYIFVRNESGTFLRQVLGPAKPVVVGNIGAGAIRVDTPLGKFMIPAGTILRLDRNAPFQRERKKVLLTFAELDGTELRLESALLLESGRWKPLNICASEDQIQVKNGAFAVQALTCVCYPQTVILMDPPDDPDYEIYFQLTSGHPKVRFAGLGIKDVGLTRKHHTFRPKQNVIYDFQKLRQALTAALMEQCTAQLPNLDAANAPLEQDVPWPEPSGDETGGSAGFEPLGWPDPLGSGT